MISGRAALADDIGYSQDDKRLILYASPERILIFPRRLVSGRDIAGISAKAVC